MGNNIKPEIEPQFLDSCTFLSTIFRGTKDNIEFRLKDNKTGVCDQTFQKYDSDEAFDKFYDHLKGLNEAGSEVYISPTTRFADKGDKNSVSEVTSLWVDIDCESEEDKVSKLNQIYVDIHRTGLMPTIFAESGHGYHLYFKLTEILHILNDTNRVAVESCLRWLAREFGGDHVTDISRVMRLPGLMNMKDPSNPKKCSIIDIYPNNIYDVKRFGTIPKHDGSSKTITLGEIPDKIPDKFYNDLKSNKKLKLTWTGKRDDLYDNSGSGKDMALGGILHELGYSIEESARIILEAPYDKTNPRTDKYLKHTLSKIFSQTSPALVVPEQGTENFDLSDFTLKKEDFDTSNINYLIEDFFPGNSLILLTSKFGTGKSIFELALTKKFIEDGYKVVIVDADMGVQVIAERLEAANLVQYIDSQLFYFHCSKLPMKIDAKNQEWNTFKGLVERHEELIIFFDTFKDLVPTGADIDHDAAVIPIMSELKSIRDMGHTVVLLHHIGKDGGKNNPFKNSGSIADAVDVAYLLDRKVGDTDEFTLTAFKQRIPVSKEVRYELETEFNLLTKETQQDIELYKHMLAVYNYMTENNNAENGYLQKDIITAMKDRISKHKIIQVLRAGERKLWDKTQGARKALIYKPIELDTQKSKSLPPYIAKSLGFMDSEQ